MSQGLWAFLRQGFSEPQDAQVGEWAAGSLIKQCHPLLRSLPDLQAVGVHFASSSGPLLTGAA